MVLMEASELMLDAASDEALAHEAPRVALTLGSGEKSPEGTLYVTTRRVVWLPTAGAAGPTGVQVDFPTITMHAVSRADPEAQPCIYMQLAGGECDEGSDDEPMTELRLAPADAEQLDAIFSALCDCAALNPDPDASDGDEEEAQWFGDVGGGDAEPVLGEALPEDAAAAAARLEAMLRVDDEANAAKFADADDEE
eukprot:PRCOL_00002770-RA